MPDAPGTAFHYQIEETKDEADYITTTIKCQGKLISENADEIRKLVQPLLQRGAAPCSISRISNISTAQAWERLWVSKSLRSTEDSACWSW